MADHHEAESDHPGLLSTPVTLLFSLCWLITFGLLAFVREGPISFPRFLYGGFVPSQLSHCFGDVTPLGLYGGQYWRAVTATFIHFNAIHLLLNLIAFFQLGRVVESWYGSLQFLAIYVILGAGANLIANLLRPWVNGPESLIVHSGGGSTVVLGLIGIVAVVGFRNPSEFPKRAPFWMVGILVANGLLGAIIPNIDNLGHAAGAGVGALIGLLDRRMIRLARSRVPLLIGVIAAVTLIGSVVGQIGHRRDERAMEVRAIELERLVRDLSRVHRSYRELAMRGLSPRLLFVPRPPNLAGRPILSVPEDPSVVDAWRQELRDAIGTLGDRIPETDSGDLSEAAQTIRSLSARSLFKPPNPEELGTFEQEIVILSRPTINAWATTRVKIERLKRPEPRFGRRALSRLVQRAKRPRADAEVAPSSPSKPTQTPSSNESVRETPKNNNPP